MKSPQRTPNSFFVGFFCISIKADMKVKMVIALDKSQGNGGVK